MSRAHLTRPRIVLVDEASFGLTPLVVDKIYVARGERDHAAGRRIRRIMGT